MGSLWNSCGGSILLAEPLFGVQYIPTSLTNHVIPPGISSLVLLGYVWGTMEKHDLLHSCNTV